MLYFRKIIVFIVIIVIFCGYFLQIQKAEAGGWPTIDVAHIAKTAYSYYKTAKQWAKEWGLLDFLDSALADFINDFNTQVAKWIQGGGDPKYVTDWEGYLKRASERAQDQVIAQIGAAPLCTPFKMPIVNLTLIPVQEFRDRIACTFEDVGHNLEDFYKDFRRGEWLGYTEQWVPQNNYFGTAYLAMDELERKKAEAEETHSNEAMASKGFLSTKRCLEYYKDSTSPMYEAYNNMMNNCQSLTTEEEKGNCITSVNEWGNNCSKEKVITPGDMAAEAAAGLVNSERDKALNSKTEDAIYKLVKNVTNSVINRLAKEGIAAFTDEISDNEREDKEQAYIDIIDRKNQEQKTNMITEINKLVAEWQYILERKDRSPVNSSLSYVQQTLAVFRELHTRSQMSPPCNPPVSDEGIAIIQTSLNQEIIRLDAEVKDIEIKINDVNTLVASINDADFNNIRQSSLIKDQYFQFIEKYNTDAMFDQMYSGSARKAADDERDDKREELNDAQARLNTCIQMQTPATP